MKRRMTFIQRKCLQTIPRRGMALIIVLFFVVLLTVLVFSLLSRATFDQQISAGSVGQAKADYLVRSASDIILGELRQEIANPANSYIYSSDGTDVTSNPDSGMLPYIYEPQTAQNIVPAKAGAPAADWTTMLKRSYATTSANASLFPNGRSLAAYGASAAASMPSLNGRFVDDTTWRMPSLLVSGASATPVDTNWCILTRSGVQSVSDANINTLRDQTSDNYAIGRFSYIIYDTGGAMDLNVAGAPSNVTGTSLQGTMAGANLTVAGLTTAQASDLIAFRNATSGTTQSSFLTGATQARGLGYLQALQGDNAFLSRQDLINFATSNGFSSLLPSLTHFSRETNASSWSPRNNASVWGGTGYPYSDNRNTSTSVNRFIPNVRLPGSPTTSYTITSYKNNGSPFTYTVYGGDPLVQRRFPLGRLQWLSPRTGPIAGNGGTAANIQACFGLKWDTGTAGDPHWDYVGPTGSSVQTTIETLKQVAAETPKREPNFFELLQAGILQGSLGQAPTNNPSLVANNPSPYAAATPSSVRSASHVIQIGANLIDEQSSSGFPTRIFFNNLDFYGTKNIPYMSKFLLSAYSPPATSPIAPFGPIYTWIEFEMWNPYQQVASLSDQPTDFRILLKGPAQNALTCWLDSSKTASLLYQPAQPTVGAGSTIEFKSSNISQLTQDPLLLDYLRQKGVAFTASQAMDIYNKSTPAGNASYTGLYIGQIPSLNHGDSVSKARVVMNGTGTTPTTFLLQANDPTNGWVTVQSLAYDANYDNLDNDVIPIYGGNTQIQTPNTTSRLTTFGIVDPRTQRFGYPWILAANYFSNYNIFYLFNRTYAWLQSNTPGQDVLENDLHASMGSSFLPVGATSDVAAYRYADNQGNGGSVTTPCFLDQDGVQRRGDATWSTVNPMLPYASYASAQNQRPVILNRAFQTVAEMGYAFRDEPFHSLDFFSTKSGDGALLDLFTTADADESATRAGTINLNSATTSSLNLQSLIQGTIMENLQSTPLSSTAAQVAASGLTSYTATTPCYSPGDLPTYLAGLTTSPFNNILIKGQRESVLRGIGEAGQTRTWNLLVDIIAQAGRYPPTAASLNQFAVEGERRYWVHVAIDRFTGKIVSQQLEPITN